MSGFGFSGFGGMSILNNVPSLFAQRSLMMTGFSLNNSLTRLSTGLAINRGADSPAGLIASENLRAELFALDAASQNTARADLVLNVAESGMGEVSMLLGELNGTLVAAASTAGTSDAERDAFQFKIDSLLSAIDRVGGSTSFSDMRLLDGGRTFRSEGMSAEIESVDVRRADVSPGDEITVDIQVTAAAETAGFVLSFGGTDLDLASSSEQFVLEISGSEGSVELTFSDGTSLDDIAAAISAAEEVTGVEASVSGTAVVLRSEEYGSDEFVSVEVSDDGGITDPDAGVYEFVEGDPSTVDPAIVAAFADATEAVRDAGEDIEGIINGVEAAGSGRTLSVSSEMLDLEILLAATSTGPGVGSATSTGSVPSFQVIGGPAFQLGPTAGMAGRAGISLPTMSARALGRVSDDGEGFSLADLRSGGSLSLRSGNFSVAQESIRTAVRDVASERGRLGAFQRNTLASTARSLNSAFINTASAESAIRDTDFAFEISSLMRSQTLFSSGVTMLGLASAQPMRALSLLG